MNERKAFFAVLAWFDKLTTLRELERSWRDPHPFPLPLAGEGEGEGISRKGAKRAKARR